MTIDNFIPTVWAAGILENLNDDHVYANAVNRDYEGDIKAWGDTVKINSIGRVTIRDYTKGATLTAPETLDDAQQQLVINQAKYFNFEIDNIDKRQQKPKLMGAATEEAAWGLASTTDSFLSAMIAATIDTANILADKSVGFGAGDDNPYEILVDIDVQLTTTNTPKGNRWCIVPPWFEGALRKDERFVSFGTPGNRANLRGKPVGEASGLNIWISNTVPTDGSNHIVLAGFKGAVTFAEQISEVEAFRPHDRFADALKGLHLYGGKVTRPSNLCRVEIVAA